jgi:hypothetical protein
MFIPCMNDACIGKPKLCVDGYGGNLCTKCDPGLTRDDTTFECASIGVM